MTSQDHRPQTGQVDKGSYEHDGVYPSFGDETLLKPDNIGSCGLSRSDDGKLYTQLNGEFNRSPVEVVTSVETIETNDSTPVSLLTETQANANNKKGLRIISAYQMGGEPYNLKIKVGTTTLFTQSVDPGSETTLNFNGKTLHDLPFSLFEKEVTAEWDGVENAGPTQWVKIFRTKLVLP